MLSKRLADQLDPPVALIAHTEDLRTIAAAEDTARVEEDGLTEAVQQARIDGRSRNQIAATLAVSRQAVRQRFGPQQPA